MQLTKQRILFIDDDSRFLEGIRHTLREYRWEWEMLFITSIEEALVLAEQTRLNTIVMDLVMPGVQGFEFLRKLKELTSSEFVPIIVLTGYGEQKLKHEALELGATDLLSKPVQREDLLARIRNVLNLKQSHDQLREMNEDLEQRVVERTRDLSYARLDVVWRLAKAGEFRDEETGNHVVRVGCYSRLLAEALGSPQDWTERLFLTSPLHDIGKIGIPDAILLKPGALTTEERQLIQQHCRIGASILLDNAIGMTAFLEWIHEKKYAGCSRVNYDLLRMAANIAMSHHERWDGSGYPLGLRGEDIPPEARIVALADVFDAVCSKRPYKEAESHEQTVAMICAGAGTQFDPEVVAAFKSLAKQFLEIRQNHDDNGELSPLSLLKKHLDSIV